MTDERTDGGSEHAADPPADLGPRRVDDGDSAASPDDRRLHGWVDRARVQLSRAHAVYSNFPVGAVVVSGDGNLYDGVNVENAAYGLTMCAERVAIGSMVAAGDRSGIAVVAVAGRGHEPLTPCGACRQVIAEFATPRTEVVSRGADGALARWTVRDLLPDAFGPLRLAAGATGIGTSTTGPGVGGADDGGPDDSATDGGAADVLGADGGGPGDTGQADARTDDAGADSRAVDDAASGHPGPDVASGRST